jgi:hypothetical protein
MRSTIIAFLCLIFLCNLPLIAQPVPIKYGKIDTAELKMRVYSLDTTAQALVLCDFGDFDANTLTFTRHMRVKIFKKEGAGFVNQMVNTPFKGEIKGCTYNWKNGKVVETKLKDESIFKEHVRDNLDRFRVTMPDVVDGSIIELVYSFMGLPDEWRFQDIIPVKWSELRIPFSPYFSFQKIFYGFQPLYINASNRWVGRNMPALNEEPFTSSLGNFITKIELQLVEVTIPGIFYQFYATSWDAVNSFLLKSNLFGMQIREMGLFLSSESKEINNKPLSNEQKLIEAYSLIKRKIKWNEESSLYSTRELAYAFKHESGNSADINLALIKLLKKLDFEVYPVAISTRENGILSPVFPTLDKLNYVIAYVRSEGKSYFLDATEKNLPFGMLPERCLNGRGRIIDETKADWIDLSTDKSERKIIYSNLKIEESGTMTGTLRQTLFDYAALNFRNDYKNFNNTNEYVAKFESESPGTIIKNLSLENMDSLDLPVKAIFDLTVNNQVDMMGDIIGFNPFLNEKMKESPFKNEDRKYPVDFSYRKEYKYIHVFQIPASYEIGEIPASLNLAMPDNKAKFIYKISVNADFIRLNVQFEISSTIFTETEYKLLREFYSQVISKEAELVILKKKL